MSKELAKKESTEVGMAIDFGADAGIGMENADAEAFAIPFLKIIQGLSPYVIRGKPEYNPDARPGMFVNSVTGELFDGDQGIEFLQAHYERTFIRWAPRGTKGKGFQGEILPENVAAMIEDGIFVKEGVKVFAPPEGFKGVPDKDTCDSISDTRKHYGILAHSAEPVLLSLDSSDIKTSKQIMTILQSFRIDNQTPPTWMLRLRLTTVPDSNEKGDWFALKVTPIGRLEDTNLYNTAKAFNRAIRSGEAKADYAKADEEGKF